MPSGIYRQANARKPVSHIEEAVLVRDPARPQRAFEYSREGTRAIFRGESNAVFSSVGLSGHSLSGARMDPVIAHTLRLDPFVRSPGTAIWFGRLITCGMSCQRP